MGDELDLLQTERQKRQAILVAKPDDEYVKKELKEIDAKIASLTKPTPAPRSRSTVADDD